MSPPKGPPVSVAEVLQQLDLEPSRLRYYQTQFRDCLTPTRPGQIQRSLPAADVETLRAIHHLMTVRKLSVPEAAAYIRKRSATVDLLADDEPGAPLEPTAVLPAARYGKVITVTSGKGGVGKTSLSLNLAAELARMGFRTALLDADLGLANVHIMSGITPRATLEDVVNGHVTMRQALTPGPRGVNILPGASGLLSLAELGAFERARLVEQLVQLEEDHDVVLIDTGAGLSHQVLDFLACADEAVVVTTGELTAVADAYAMIKVLNHRQPTLPIRVLVNRVASPYEATVVMRRLTRCAEKFLNYTTLGEVGYVLEDPAVRQAVQTRTPFVVGNPRSRAAKCIRRAAENLMAVELRRGESRGPRATIARWFSATRPAAPPAPVPVTEA